MDNLRQHRLGAGRQSRLPFWTGYGLDQAVRADYAGGVFVLAAMSPGHEGLSGGVGKDVGIMQDVLKIAVGVFLGMMAFWIFTVVLPAIMPPSAQERAAQDLLERQFGPAN